MEYKEFIDKVKLPISLNVIFQLTDLCVLDCKYCFAKGSHENEEIYKIDYPEKIIKSGIKQAFETNHKVVYFEWTGGEPFLLGLDFFKLVIQYQKECSNKDYENYIQTSGFVLNKELIDFLIHNKFIISTTIDGTEDVQNFNRPTQGGTKSFEQVLQTREYIISKQGYCGFISTVTKRNLGKETEILSLFRELGLNSFHSNPYLYFEKNIVKDKTIALDNKDYAKYMVSLFNTWFEQGIEKPIPNTINYILESLKQKKGLSQTLCTFGGRCLTNFIAISPNGDAYNCPKFIGHKNMTLGNIMSNPIKTLLDIKSVKMSNLINQRIKAINKCENENCKFLYLCNGGCPYYSYINSNGLSIDEKDYLCEGKYTLYEYLEQVLEITGFEPIKDEIENKYSTDIQKI